MSFPYGRNRVAAYLFPSDTMECAQVVRWRPRFCAPRGVPTERLQNASGCCTRSGRERGQIQRVQRDGPSIACRKSTSVRLVVLPDTRVATLVLLTPSFPGGPAQGVRPRGSGPGGCGSVDLARRGADLAQGRVVPGLLPPQGCTLRSLAGLMGSAKPQLGNLPLGSALFEPMDKVCSPSLLRPVCFAQSGCDRTSRSAVIWPPFLFCPGITTELARCACDPPAPAPGWLRKGRLVPHEAPFSISAMAPNRVRCRSRRSLPRPTIGCKFEWDERTGPTRNPAL
jgi:hypothetical protein